LNARGRRTLAAPRVFRSRADARTIIRTGEAEAGKVIPEPGLVDEALRLATHLSAFMLAAAVGCASARGPA